MASHEELIKAGSFDEKFKNTLRDYYTYGFKSYQELQSPQSDGTLKPSASTLNADWTRLTNILFGYFDWSVEKNKVFFMSSDSQSMAENPFHRVYRFCRYNERDPKNFFNTILALSPNAALAQGMESLELEKLADTDPYHRLSTDLRAGRPLTSAQLLCFFPDDAPLFVGENNTINKRLKELKATGLITDTAEKQPGAKKAVHRWSLTNAFLKDLLAAGSQASKDFETHFQDALDFFSKYTPLGAVGSILLSRYRREIESPFRFKHEYFTQALNDYALVDLLYAMENRQWCRIEYRHGISGEHTKLICFPLEVRICTTNGRQYLSCYEPFSRSYSNLRLEFIESVSWISDGSIRDAQGNTISLSTPQVQSDIANTLAALEHTWGAATAAPTNANAIHPVPLQEVKLTITYNPETEQFILNRLRREKRIGSIEEFDDRIEFTVEVANARELRPWIRSFYSRLLRCSGMREEDFSIKNDLTAIQYVLDEDEIPIEEDSTTARKLWDIPEGVTCSCKSATAHQLLFNEFFSVYYAAMSDVLMQLSCKPQTSFTESEISTITGQVLNSYGSSLGIQTRRLLVDEIREMMTSGAFLRQGFVKCREYFDGYLPYGSWMKEPPAHLNRSSYTPAYYPKYQGSSTAFYRDILPLSTLECRWLLNMLDDPKIRLFLSPEERRAVLDYLAASTDQSCRPLPLHKIRYPDRFLKQDQERTQEAAFMNPLLSAIREQRLVNLTYRSARGKLIHGEFAPLVIEYSKRDDLFRGYFLSMRSRKIFTMNIARLKHLEPTDRNYDPDETQLLLAQYRESNTQRITIEFYDVKNTADRILTEFSPWRKRCIYNRATGLYSLTICFQKQDSLELVIRLLGYGSSIRITEKDTHVFEEYAARIQKQIQLERRTARTPAPAR